MFEAMRLSTHVLSSPCTITSSEAGHEHTGQTQTPKFAFGCKLCFLPRCPMWALARSATVLRPQPVRCHFQHCEFRMVGLIRYRQEFH